MAEAEAEADPLKEAASRRSFLSGKKLRPRLHLGCSSSIRPPGGLGDKMAAVYSDGVLQEVSFIPITYARHRCADSLLPAIQALPPRLHA